MDTQISTASRSGLCTLTHFGCHSHKCLRTIAMFRIRGPMKSSSKLLRRSWLPSLDMNLKQLNKQYRSISDILSFLLAVQPQNLLLNSAIPGGRANGELPCLLHRPSPWPFQTAMTSLRAEEGSSKCPEWAEEWSNQGTIYVRLQ